MDDILSVADGELVLNGGRYPAVWLRDNCPCTECADPGGQKLHDVTDIPPDSTVTEANADDDNIVVTFGPDGHRGAFARSWLADHKLDGYEDERDGRELWDTAADLTELPEASWPGYVADPEVRLTALEAVLQKGLVILRDVPPQDNTVLKVAESFGYVRETNYGRLFDVRIEPAPGNLAFTSREILPHTDNPYRDPVPTLQLLHCLRAADEGGDTGLVDGFAAAEELRTTAPDKFRRLASTTVRYEYQDKEAHLTASQPLIQLSPRGTVRGIRFNNRSVRPFRLPYEQVPEFYDAYRAWAELVARPERRLAMRLAPGDCLVFDNRRILHARTAFSVTGSRHLQGCYADVDGLASTVAVARREGGKQ